MALELDISTCIKSNCTKLILQETTGAYDVTLNTTGWGTPNPATSDADSVSIVITTPDGTVVTITDPAGLPTSNSDLEYEISATTLNSTWTKIQDGLYTIVYSVVIGADTYSVTKYVLFTCNVECCVARLFAKIATSTDCECDSTVIKNALYADALLQGLLASKNCGNVTAITSLLTKLQTICSTATGNCGCGN